MKRYLILFCLMACLNAKSQSRVEPAVKWWNPATATTPVVDGQLWPKEVERFYDRLPARVQKTVRSDVWNLSHNAAGLKLRFKTNAKNIKVRYMVTAKTYGADHFAATGRSGVDLYSINNDGTWAWANGKYKFADTISYEFSNLDLDTENYKEGREYCLYLPLYNSVKWLEIGVAENASFIALPPRKEKAIIVYGTSIAQGGVASRPGMAWTGILERDLNMPVVNLGFSGNGRLEKEVIDLVNEQDAKIFVLDCLPNLNASTDSAALDVQNKITMAVKTLRASHPTTPILLTEHSGFTENRMDAARRRGINALNEANIKAFKELNASGIKYLYVLPTKAINMGTDGTVDGTHPTDLGMYRYAQAYQQVIITLLKDAKQYHK